MRFLTIRRVGALILALLVAGAAWLLPRHPAVAIPMLMAVAAVGLMQWRAHAAVRLVRDAGLQCDVGKLEALATDGSLLARLFARVALVHHGGTDVAPPVLCTCGECEMDTLDAELEAIGRIVRLSWSGFGAKAYELAGAQDVIDEKVSYPLREAVAGFRIATRLVSYAAVAAEAPETDETPAWFALALAYVEKHLPYVVWPARLAAAREAIARSDLGAARKLLEGMPSWPDRSPLEVVRRDLVASCQAGVES